MYHYVYKLENTETGEFYIGSRSSKCRPSLDKYMGSMCTWDVDKNILKKIIIKDDFLERSDAMLFEIDCIKNNIENPLNRNYNIPGESFHTHNMITVKDNNGKTYLISKDDHRYINGELKFMWVGKKHTETAKEKMSNSAKKRIIPKDVEKERREKISSKLKGVKKSDDFVKKMSESRKGENNPYTKYLKENNLQSPMKGVKYEKIECQYCKRLISKTIIHVKHQENCKLKTKQNPLI